MNVKNKIRNFIHILLREETPPELVIAAIFESEESFLNAVKKIPVDNIKGLDAITPYPVHGLEELLKIKRSWLPWVTFIFGLIGLSFGLFFTWWVSVVSWPLNIGGKPLFSLPAFIPIAFECTILFSALATVGSLFYACGLPKINPPVLDSDLTCHKFALYCPVKGKDVESMKAQWNQLEFSKIIIGKF